MSTGIDYGMGLTNVDTDTGIRYGIISANAMGEWFWDSVEPEYACSCGFCGEDPDPSEEHTECPTCGKTWSDPSEAYGEEPSANVINDGETQGFLDDYNDVWCTHSPYFTLARFCSPCAPGACSLSCPDDDGAKAYCFGHDWFGDGGAPYPVYSVATGEMVKPN